MQCAADYVNKSVQVGTITNVPFTRTNSTNIYTIVITLIRILIRVGSFFGGRGGGRKEELAYQNRNPKPSPPSNPFVSETSPTLVQFSPLTCHRLLMTNFRSFFLSSDLSASSTFVFARVWRVCFCFFRLQIKH